MRPDCAEPIARDPAADHLLELREIIYPTVKLSPPPPLAAAEAAGYRLQREEGLRSSVTLTDAKMIHDLVAMTPHVHRVAHNPEPKRCSRESRTRDRISSSIKALRD